MSEPAFAPPLPPPPPLPIPPSPPTWQSLAATAPLPFRYKLLHRHTTWAHTFSLRPELYLQPHTIPELRQTLHVARQCRKKVIVVGAGHSPSSITTGVTHPSTTWLLNLDHLSQVVAWDNENLRVTVEAGMRLHQLISALHAKGWALGNIGSITQQSLGGAIATGTHGSSLRHGILSENIVRLTLMLSDGRSCDCAADSNQELYEAALVSLGALGVVTHVTVQAVPVYRLSWVQEVVPLAETLERWDAGTLWGIREFERVWWYPYSDRAVIWAADKEQDPNEKQKDAYSFLATKRGYHIYQFLLYLTTWIPSLTPPIERMIFRIEYGCRDGVVKTAANQPYEKALLLNCMFRQYVNEWAIPLHCGPAAISRFQAWIEGKHFSAHNIPIENKGTSAHSPIEVRVSNSTVSRAPTTPSGVRALLDPTQEDGPTLYLNPTVYRPYGKDIPERKRFYEAFEYLMREYGGRPHWAKNFLGAEEGEGEVGVEEMYGDRLRKWRRVRRKVDPEGMFRSRWVERNMLGHSINLAASTLVEASGNREENAEPEELAGGIGESVYWVPEGGEAVDEDEGPGEFEIVSFEGGW